MTAAIETSLLDLCRDAVLGLAEDGCIVFANQAAVALLGPALEGKSIQSVLPVADAGTLRWKDRLLTVRRHPLSGGTAAVALVLEDSTKEHHGVYQLAEAMPSMVWTARTDGSCDYFNQRWLSYTGAVLGTVLEGGWMAYVHPDDQAAMVQAWQSALASGKAVDVEYRLRDAHGGYRWFLSRAVPLLDRGLITRWIGTCTDIHEQKKASGELLDAAEERRVAERTRALLAANERLQEIDRLKSDFLATMSHELRTPLNSIIGFTGVILQGLAGDLNDEQKKQLTLVYNAGQHLLRLISEILDVSRIESGKARVQVESFDLGAIIVHVADSMEVMVAKKGLSVDLVGALDGATVVSDRQKVTQILLNLIGNAIKFTPRGKLSVSWRIMDPQFEIVVSDTGIGMKESDLQHLFEPFRQLDHSSQRAYEGTGLGLYLSRKLAQLLGGDITVQSVLGEGTRFTVLLPSVGSDR